MKITTFEDAKVGDKVWDSRKGWGVVNELIYSSDYPIIVDFSHDYESYTLDGYYFEDDVNPSLFWDEVVIEAPPKPLPDLPVDTKVLVWNNDDNNVKHRRYFSHFGVDGEIITFHSGQTSWSTNKTATWSSWELVE